MAFKRIKDLTDATVPADMVDGEFAMDPTAGDTRKVSIYDIYEMMGLEVYANIAAAPSASLDSFAFIKAVRKQGEGAGLGTGAVCRGDGANWRLWSNNTVAAE